MQRLHAEAAEMPTQAIRTTFALDNLQLAKLLSGFITGQKAVAKMVVRVAGSRFMQLQSVLLCRFPFEQSVFL